MFTVLSFRTPEVSCGRIRIAEDGLAAVRKREELGLPASSKGIVTFVPVTVEDRRAAEAWPEALNSMVNHPAVSTDYSGDDSELQDMLRAGILGFSGPVKIENTVGLSMKLLCSPFELVCWRRAWAAEQRAEQAKQRANRAERELEEMQAEQED